MKTYKVKTDFFKEFEKDDYIVNYSSVTKQYLKISRTKETNFLPSSLVENNPEHFELFCESVEEGDELTLNKLPLEEILNNFTESIILGYKELRDDNIKKLFKCYAEEYHERKIDEEFRFHHLMSKQNKQLLGICF